MNGEDRDRHQAEIDTEAVVSTVLRAQETERERQEAALDQRAREEVERGAALDEHQIDQNRRDGELDAREYRLDQREWALDARQDQLDARAVEADERDRRANERDRVADQREIDGELSY